MSENNCASCRHKQHADGGYCYMFRIAPPMPCAKHSNRFLAAQAMRINTVRATLKEPKP